jgi:glutamate synthase domain-containing protein 2
MNRIGAKSDSGEGGEDPSRFVLRENGDNPSSAYQTGGLWSIWCDG